MPPGVPLRQWVLTVPFAWRRRLGYDAPLLSTLTRLFVKGVLEFTARPGLAELTASAASDMAASTGSDARRCRSTFFALPLRKNASCKAPVD